LKKKLRKRQSAEEPRAPTSTKILKKPLANEVVEGLVAWNLEVVVGQNVSNVRADGKTSNDI